MKSFLIFIVLGVQLVFFSCKEKIEMIAKNYYSIENGDHLENYIVYPQGKSNLPVILILHEWTGLGEYVKKRAEMLAKLGYFVYAMDMYGKGNRATNHKEAAELMGKFTKNPERMLQRISSSINEIKQFTQVNKYQIVGIGYCFGGGALLSLASSGNTSLKGIVSFHGMLQLPQLEQLHNIKMNIEIHHGEKDSFIPLDKVTAFKQTMLKNENIQYNFYNYPEARHAFTRWTAKGGADNTPDANILYNKEADKESWSRTISYLKQEFQQ